LCRDRQSGAAAGAGDLPQSIQVGETSPPRLCVASRRATPIVKWRTSIPARFAHDVSPILPRAAVAVENLTGTETSPQECLTDDGLLVEALQAPFGRWYHETTGLGLTPSVKEAVMVDDQKILGERGRALEEEFFRKEDQRLTAKAREVKAKEASREELSRISGIKNTAILDRLVPPWCLPPNPASYAPPPPARRR